jgi:hypothetical protein
MPAEQPNMLRANTVEEKRAKLQETFMVNFLEFDSMLLVIVVVEVMASPF